MFFRNLNSYWQLKRAHWLAVSNIRPLTQRQAILSAPSPPSFPFIGPALAYRCTLAELHEPGDGIKVTRIMQFSAFSPVTFELDTP